MGCGPEGGSVGGGGSRCGPGSGPDHPPRPKVSRRFQRGDLRSAAVTGSGDPATTPETLVVVRSPDRTTLPDRRSPGVSKEETFGRRRWPGQETRPQLGHNSGRRWLMPIFDQGYQHWQGTLSSHAWRWLTVTRHGVRGQLQNRWTRLIMLFAWGAAAGPVGTCRAERRHPPLRR